LLLISCSPLQRTSPFSELNVTTANDLNGQAIEQLTRMSNTSNHFTFIAIADSHQNYDSLRRVVSVASGQEAVFLVHLGDFTNQGYNIEYDQYLQRMKKLPYPFLTVIGNHDALVKGKSLYRRLFGEFNKIFEFRGYRFILFNNNNLDFYADGGTDWGWLENAIATSSLPVVLFFHINPDNQDYFTPDDLRNFQRILTGSKVRMMVHGHNHVFQTEIQNGILQHQVHRTQGTHWSRIRMSPTEITIETCSNNECAHATTQTYP
jgi:predicted phosphodiesterase